MIDCHFHVWTADNSTPEKRAERAEMVREEAEAMGVDRIALIGEVGTTLEECREANRTVAAYVEEYPDLFYGWARVDPRLGEDAVAEFRRAVQEDGLVGLKHHFYDGTPVNISDPVFFPLAEAAVEMDVPIIAHVMQRLEEDKEHWDDSEAYTEDVLELARRYPDLKLISAHILAGGDPEYRIKNVRDQENVYLDVSGSVTGTGVAEMAAAELGVDRLVFGTDTWFVPGVGKLEGCDLSPGEKATVAYNFEELLSENVPNRLDPDELDARREAARERFASVGDGRQNVTIVDANAFLGRWPFRKLEYHADDLLGLMDEKGVDRALVSSMGAVLYRNVQHGNRELRAAVEGHEDRLLPVATINPSYPGWEDDLAECLDEFDMRAVKLLPAYHDYDPNHPAAKDLLERCADRNVPVILGATLEDHRGRHPRFSLRGFGEGDSKYWTDDQVAALIDLLEDCPETDVILADCWENASRIHEAVCEVRRNGVRLDNRVRDGETLFVLDDLNMYFTYLGEEIVEDLGVDHLAFGPKLPFRIFESTYNYVEGLSVDDSAEERVRSGNVLDLLGS